MASVAGAVWPCVAFVLPARNLACGARVDVRQPLVDQPACNRDAGRQQWAVIVLGPGGRTLTGAFLACLRRADLVGAEPARFLEFVADLRLVRMRIGLEAQHQR